jgi:NAD+ dependent glucose-6-phosphate dehydrogenase
MKRKKILILGGMGEIGRILTQGLCSSYEVTVADIINTDAVDIGNYVQIDVTDFNQLMAKVTPDIDVIINLTGLTEKKKIVSSIEVKEMSNLYVVGSYNVLLIAKTLGIRRVIFASTNHVTGQYEDNGHSTLGRPIKSSDYPSPDNTYGAMKACAELFGSVFATEGNLSVVCLRVGTVQGNEMALLMSNDRAHRTLLSTVDTTNLFLSAIEAKIDYGVYYGVSDNPGKPWDIENAIHDLSYKPTKNSKELVSHKTLFGLAHGWKFCRALARLCMAALPDFKP